MVPDKGQAGTPYSRNVQSTHGMPTNLLPDPVLVFDTLLKRDKVSSSVVTKFLSFV